MSSKPRHSQDSTGLPATPIRQDSTNWTVLCLDGDGYHHIFDAEANRIVVIDHEGIDRVEDLDEYPDKDIADWINFVQEGPRGVAKIQKYTGEMLFGDQWGRDL
jgi:hypothetical protein